jgi:quinol monooxygenase YgiN
MPRALTVLEAHVEPGREAALLAAYQDAAREPVPPGLVRSALLRDVNDSTLWRIETVWESHEALEAMRRGGTPRGLQIFLSAGAQPSLTIFDVAAELPTERRATGA